MRYIVVYRVEGFEGVFSSGPYDTAAIAEEHRRDIDGYEGVCDCEIREHVEDDPPDTLS